MAIPEQNLSIEELQAELSRMVDLYENTRINYQMLDPEGSVIYVNNAWLECLGYKPNEILGKPFQNIVIDTSGIEKGTHIKNLIQDDSNKDIELTLCCSDGSEMNASFSCFRNRDSKGKLINIHCVFQNITKLRKTEEALRISEDKYERIFNSFRDVYYQTDRDSNIILISPSVKKTGGYDPGELLGRSVGDFFQSAEDRSKFRQLLETRGFVDDYDLRLKKKDGNLIDVSLSAHLILDETGKIEKVEGVIRDITKRKEYESEIASYNNTLKEITDRLPAVLFQLKQDHLGITIDFVSPNVEERLGIPVEEIIQNPTGILSSIVSKNDRKNIQSELSRALKSKKSAEIECEVTLKNGGKGWSRTKLSPKQLGPDEIIWTGISTDITEEVMMKNFVREQEEQLKALYEFANVGIAAMSLGGIVTAINPAVSNITGYAENELVGKHFKNAAVFYKKDLAFYTKLFSNAVQGKIPRKSVVFAWKHKSGEKRWAEAYLNLIKDRGKIKGFQGVFMDVTERILLQQAEKDKQRDIEYLFESAVRFLKMESEEKVYRFLSRKMADLLPGAIVNLNSMNEDDSLLRVESVTGLTGKIEKMILKLFDYHLNGRTFSIDQSTFDYSKHGKILKVHDNLYDLTLHQIPRELCNQIEKIIQLNEIYELSMGVGDKLMGGCAIFLRKDQQIKNVGLIETLFRQASQTLSRLRTLQQLKSSEEHYRSLAENAQDLILRVDRDLVPLYANHAFLKTFDLKWDQFVKKGPLKPGLPLPIGDIILKTINHTFTSGNSRTCDNVIYIDNKPNFFEWRMFPEFEKKKQVQSALMFIRNISSRKMIEAKIQENIENKNKIYSLISHDLRTPFISLLGFLDLLKGNYHQLSDELRLKYIDNIYGSSQNLLNLLNSLQDWSHGFEQEKNINPVYFDLQQMINSTLDLFKLQTIEKNIMINNTIPDGVIVKADYNMIAASVRNIISNAIKFSHEGGKIQINLKKQSGNILFQIKDEGTGMSKEEIIKLFDPNSKFSKKGTNGEQGTGFGIKLAKEFIDLNKGTLKIKSQPGKGCSVTIGLMAQ